ncbi:hypothetical protein ACFWJ5_02950 [Streptomyces qaidamensis]|uniref:hypothetical protein n=1 Tax=Streptomyces qaidamensis TaxID=1783515 RepID=UPI003647F8A0
MNERYLNVDQVAELLGTESAAGKLTVSIPAAIIPDIRDHLERYAEAVRRAAMPGSRACTPMIFGTRATPWRPPLARAHVS